MDLVTIAGLAFWQRYTCRPNQYQHYIIGRLIVDHWIRRNAIWVNLAPAGPFDRPAAVGIIPVSDGAAGGCVGSRDRNRSGGAGVQGVRRCHLHRAPGLHLGAKGCTIQQLVGRRKDVKGRGVRMAITADDPTASRLGLPQPMPGALEPHQGWPALPLESAGRS